MKNIWILFRGDLKRLTRNVVTVIIVLGLVFLPSLFSWYNLIACWNVFDNTGNLKVAVANADEGYESDLVPIEVNIGEKVVSELRANDQLKWTFTSVDDAIDGAKSGRYYAAVVIPESFSRDMMTFFSDDVEHAQIVYYSNEKKNAIAPKVTDQGADRVSAEVNQVFAKTLSEAALGLSSALIDYADDADLNGRIGVLSGHIASVGQQMSKASSVLSSYAGIVASSRAIIGDSANLIAQVKSSAADVMSTVDQAKGAAGEIVGALDQSTSALSTALEQSASSMGSVGAAVDKAFSSTNTLAVDSAGQLRAAASNIDAQIAGYRDLADSLNALAPSLPDKAFSSTNTLAVDSAGQLRAAASNIDAQIAGYRDLADSLNALAPSLPDSEREAVEALVARINASIQLQEQLRDALGNAATAVEKGNADAQAKHDEIKQLAADAEASFGDVKADYDQNVKPGLDALSESVADAGASLQSTTGLLDSVGADLSGSADSMAAQLTAAQSKLQEASADMQQTSDKLTEFSQRLDAALAAGDTQALREIIGSDPSALASALAAPVQLDRHAVYPVADFGSAMSPLYTTLALWIGALLVMVTLKVTPSSRTLEELDNPTAPQLFLGRFGVVALLSLLQSTIMCVGNMLFLHVQTVEPLLYLLCFWASGLVFAFIIYTLVVSFANLGKALSVFLLIIQVSGGGGSYPLQVLPQFVQDVSPYLPITHAVNAMRSAMFGVYQGDFWVQLGILALFTLPFVFLGLVLRNPLIKIVSKFVEKVESTKVM